MPKYVTLYTISALLAATSLSCLGGSPAEAFTCDGNCGFLSTPDGNVSYSPQGGQYGYVTTSGGVSGAGEISGVGGTNGSQYSTDTFHANAGDTLQFYFNFITSDGTSTYPDYGWAELSTSTGTEIGYLFTARTVPTGNTSPGSGLPDNISTLVPSSSAIIPGAPSFSPLGLWSDTCFGPGCGYTGWIASNYTISLAGDYVLTFGVTNYVDTQYDTALAFDGASVGGTVIGGGGGGSVSPVPLPASAPMLGGALMILSALGYHLKRKKVAVQA